MLEKKLASEHVPEEEQINLLKDLERTETEYMRLKRHKICVEDFDLLTIIGRGAFGEVRDRHSFCNMHRCLVEFFFSFTFLLFSLVKKFFLVGSILKISYAKKVSISLFQQPVSSFIVISVIYS